MECNGYKGSDLFVKTLSSLNEKISLEERLFRQFVNSDEYEQVKGDIDIYCKKEEFFLRIRDQITLYDVCCLKNESDDEETLEMKDIIEKTGQIFDISSKNIFLLYAYFLDNTIDKLVVRSLKRKLLSIKYYNCMIKHNLENVLLNNNFNFAADIYSDLYLKIDLMRMDEEYTTKVILDSYMTSINSSIENLMANADSEYSTNEGMLAVSINYQCLLKAVFALMSEYEYRILEDDIIVKIEELRNEDNDGMVENIMDIIDNRNEYRSKVKKLSLKPLK